MTTKTQPLGRASIAARERAAWLVLGILLLFSIAAPLNQFKVPPIMPVLMDAFKLSVGRAGLLMSVYAVTGLILALPAGFIFQKAGQRVTGLIAGGSIVIGAVLGATSQDVGALLASRVIEGAGTSFMAVLAPAIIAQWFVAQRRGTAMGIWSAWVPVGTAITLLVAPSMVQSGSWRGVWWLGAVYAALATVLYFVFVRPAPAMPDVRRADGRAGGIAAVTASEVMRNRSIWLLAAAFGSFNLALGAFGTFLPTFLSTARSLPLAQASLVASISTLISIVSCPAGGLISDKIGSRKRPFVAGLVACALLMPLASFLSVGGLILVVVFMGLFLGLVPTNVFSAAVEAAGDERQGGLAMAIIMTGQNAGMLLGPVVFGALVESAGGWPLAFASMAIVALLGALAGWLSRVR